MSTDIASATRTPVHASDHVPVLVAPPGEVGEYEGFLADVTEELETRVEPWRLQLGEAAAAWQLQGYATGVLERAMALASAPDVHGLLSAFGAAVRHLQTLEHDAVTLDPTLAGKAAFRNPECIGEAQDLVDRARHAQPAPRSPSVTPPRTLPGSSIAHGRAPAVIEVVTVDDFFRDTEKVVWEWPDLSGRLMEEFR